MVTFGDVCVVPNWVPSLGLTVKNHTSFFAVSSAGTVRVSLMCVCSSPFLDQRTSVPFSRSPSRSK